METTPDSQIVESQTNFVPAPPDDEIASRTETDRDQKLKRREEVLNRRAKEIISRTETDRDQTLKHREEVLNRRAKEISARTHESE